MYTIEIYAQLLHYTLYSICKNQNKSIGTKAARKMLVKLTPGHDISVKLQFNLNLHDDLPKPKR